MSDSLRLEHGILAPGEARSWITQRCHEWACQDLADAAALLVSELVTNVFLHARTACLIHAAFDRPLLAVSVTDGDDRELTLTSPGPSAEDGRGLLIIDALADAWGVKHDEAAKSVWFHLSSTRHPNA